MTSGTGLGPYELLARAGTAEWAYCTRRNTRLDHTGERG
jgi:hypothetical protein